MSMASNDSDMKKVYDFSTMKSLGKGYYAGEAGNRQIIVKLDEDVALFFHDDKSVNDALRRLIQIAQKSVPAE